MNFITKEKIKKINVQTKHDFYFLFNPIVLWCVFYLLSLIGIFYYNLGYIYF